MFDSRIFDDSTAITSEPNIEFHIHAFLSPNSQGQRHQEIGVGPASESNGQSSEVSARSEPQLLLVNPAQAAPPLPPAAQV